MLVTIQLLTHLIHMPGLTYTKSCEISKGFLFVWARAQYDVLSGNQLFLMVEQILLFVKISVQVPGMMSQTVTINVSQQYFFQSVTH